MGNKGLQMSTMAGRATKISKATQETHFVLKSNRITPPFPKDHLLIVFGTGCFWGSEKVRGRGRGRGREKFWASPPSLLYHKYKFEVLD